MEQPLGFPDRYPYSTGKQCNHATRRRLAKSSFGARGWVDFQSTPEGCPIGRGIPVDFGQLFVAFSFFVIAAALALTGMLFSFSMQQRNRQAGLLMALGYSTPKIRWLFLGEGACVSLVGVTLGLWGAWGYGKTVLGLLSGEWGGCRDGSSNRVFSRDQIIDFRRRGGLVDVPYGHGMGEPEAAEAGAHRPSGPRRAGRGRRAFRPRDEMAGFLHTFADRIGSEPEAWPWR